MREEFIEYCWISLSNRESLEDLCWFLTHFLPSYLFTNFDLFISDLSWNNSLPSHPSSPRYILDQCQSCYAFSLSSLDIKRRIFNLNNNQKKERQIFSLSWYKNWMFHHFQHIRGQWKPEVETGKKIENWSKMHVIFLSLQFCKNERNE